MENNSNMTDMSYFDIAELYYGPQRYALPGVITMTIVYTLIFLMGFIGNICTCAVIVKNKSMHTTSNYYLFNLALADLLWLTFGLPIEIKYFWYRWPWIFGEPFCILRFLLAETCTFVSVWTIVVITVERYVAICHPMRRNYLSSFRRVIYTVVCIWIGSVLLSIPQTTQIGVDGHIDFARCRPLGTGAVYPISLTASMIVFGFCPLLVMCILYCLIGLTLKKSLEGFRASRRRDSCQHSENEIHSRITVIRIAVTIVVMSFICWTPFHTERLIHAYEPEFQFTKEFFMVSGVFYYMSAAINPVLYSVISTKFRNAFKAMLFQNICCKRKTRKRISVSSFTCWSDMNNRGQLSEGPLPTTPH